jgi:hypothetical protein
MKLVASALAQARAMNIPYTKTPNLTKAAALYDAWQVRKCALSKLAARRSV